MSACSEGFTRGLALKNCESASSPSRGAMSPRRSGGEDEGGECRRSLQDLKRSFQIMW